MSHEEDDTCHLGARIDKYLRIYIRICFCTYIHACMHACIRMIHTGIHAYMHIHVYAHTHTHKRAHAHIHIHIHFLACVHSYPSLSLSVCRSLSVHTDTNRQIDKEGTPRSENTGGVRTCNAPKPWRSEHMHACICFASLARTCLDTHTYTHIHTHTHTRIVYSYTHINSIFIHTYTHIYTHIHRQQTRTFCNTGQSSISAACLIHCSLPSGCRAQGGGCWA
jgi:hypothetical protein